MNQVVLASVQGGFVADSVRWIIALIFFPSFYMAWFWLLTRLGTF